MPVTFFGAQHPGSNPSQLGATHWWEFSNIVMLFQDTARTSPITANGQIVLGVTDQGTSPLHLSTATNGPTYIVSPVQTINGKACVEFDGVNDTLTNVGTEYKYQNSNSGSYTIVAVSTSQTSSAEVGSYTPGQTLISQGRYMIGTSTTTVNPNYQTEDRTTADYAIARKVQVFNTWYISTHIGVCGGQADPNFIVTSSVGLNDTRTASLVSDPSPAGTFSDGLFAYFISNVAAPWDGYVAEIAIFQPQITEAQRQSLERNWAWKYGITIPYA
jgi:hypothetical protein